MSSPSTWPQIRGRSEEHNGWRRHGGSIDKGHNRHGKVTPRKRSGRGRGRERSSPHDKTASETLKAISHQPQRESSSDTFISQSSSPFDNQTWPPSAKKQIERLKRTCSHSARLLNDLREELSKLQDALQKKGEDEHAAGLKLQEKESELNRVRDALNKHKIDTKDADIKLREIESQNSQLRSAFDEQKKRTEAAEKMSTMSCQDVTNLYATLIKQQKEASNVNVHIQQLNNALSKQRSETLDALQKVRIAEEKHDELATEINKQKQKADKAIQRAQQFKDGHFEHKAKFEQMIETAREENAKMKAKLESAHTKIFSLQSLRPDFTPDEAGPEFESLVYNVEMWAESLLRPILDDPSKMKGGEFNTRRLRQCLDLTSNRDIEIASQYPDTEVDIIVAAIMRILQPNIFDAEIPGDQSGLTNSLKLAQDSLENHVQPKRDMVAIRNWRAETLHAIFMHPDCQRNLEAFADCLADDITKEFSLFFELHMPTARENLRRTLLETVLRPSLNLHMKFQSTANKYFLQLSQYVNEDFITSSALHKHVQLKGFLKCQDVIQHRRLFKLQNISPRPSQDMLRRGLSVVLTHVPALCVRHFHAEKSVNADTDVKIHVVTSQKVLVAWGTSEGKKEFQRCSTPCVFREILAPGLDKMN